MDIGYIGFFQEYVIKIRHPIGIKQIQIELNQIYLNSTFPFYHRNSKDINYCLPYYKI